MSYLSLNRIIVALQKGKPMTDPPFKTGDEVRLNTGKSKIVVLEVDYYDDGDKMPHYAKQRWGSPGRKYAPKPGWYIRFTYASTFHYREEHSRKWREAEDFVYFHNQPEKEEPIMTKPSLYQTVAEPVRYGTFLIKNSQGQMVLEMKGEGGTVESFAEKDIEVVTPHTVELTRIGITHEEKRGATNSCHIVAKKGQVSKDEVLLEMNTGIIWRVTVVDSKCLSPRDNKSKWMKIPAAFVTLGEQ